MNQETLQHLFSIIVVNIVLSGDNVVVIGMASRQLSDQNRRRAIIWGGVGAIILRVVFTVLAALLLDVPLIQAIGGILLVFIAYQLIRPERGDGASITAGESLRVAIRTIILADLVMSLDNVLAVAGASDGRLDLLAFGLAFSIPLLLFGGNLLAKLLSRYPWLLIFGVAVLLHSAASMFVEDRWVDRYLHLHPAAWFVIAVTPVLTAAVVGLVWLSHHRLAGFGEGEGNEQDGTAAGALG